MADKEQFVAQIKGNIRKLIESGRLDEAHANLNQYESLVPDDREIYEYRATIFLAGEKLEAAKQSLQQSIEKFGRGFDNFCNLAFVHEKMGDYQSALDCYHTARSLAATVEQQAYVEEAAAKLSEAVPGLIAHNRKKLAIFVKQGLDNFIDEIIAGLADTFEAKKYIVTTAAQIDQGMNWADICWFEWCDDIVAYASQSKRSKQIICRLHSFEAFTDNIRNVKWENVDKVIFVAEHIRDYVLRQTTLRKQQTAVIPNGINLDKFSYRERKKGFNIAYVGYINYKKGPMLLLHTFKAIAEKDKRYKLFIAGKFQDGRDHLYFEQMIEEFGLQGRVIFDGWQKDISTWLEDKHYILCTSVLEGNPVGVMEAMSRGLKPLIHNFVGSKKQFGPYVWNTIADCVRMIAAEEYDSREYRAYIEKHFSLELQISRLKEVLTGPDGPKPSVAVPAKSDISKPSQEKTAAEAYYDNFLHYLKKDRETENPRHRYLKNRLKNIIQPGATVLDLGCGIGITTEYIKSLGVKEVTGVDLSPELINYARSTVKDIEFIAQDITTLELNRKYDLITLCDVMEHVPRERYEELFRVIKNHLGENGVVYIAVPDPDYLDLIREHMPEKLQIIDNSISFREIVTLCDHNELYIKFYNTYSVFIDKEYNEYLLCHKSAYSSKWKAFIDSNRR